MFSAVQMHARLNCRLKFFALFHVFAVSIINEVKVPVGSKQQQSLLILSTNAQNISVHSYIPLPDKCSSPINRKEINAVI